MNHIKELPPVLQWRKVRYEKKFMNTPNIFRGVFDSFEAALASAPETKKTGFDVPEFEGYFDNRREQLFLYDYPMLFWLDKILDENFRIFDVGGNTGVHFIGYGPYLKMWERIKWEVCEVPVIVEAGRKFSERERFEDRLSFTDDPSDADGADVLLSLGTIQYIDKPTFLEVLSSLKSPPKHLLIGKLPLYEGDPYVTLQNGGAHFVAQRVFNRKSFIQTLKDLGYELKDEWHDYSRSCYVPFHPELSVPMFTGLYFCR